MFSHCPFNTIAVQIRAFLIVVNVFTTLINDGQRLMNQIEKAGKHPERRGQLLIGGCHICIPHIYCSCCHYKSDEFSSL
ncbi:Uncharacterised protein [Salmonella enterica subsp. enterica serovar Bovismorbificans]|uniref:Uncharacterized protein n=1 Tax=Salmonella enterica subsp. enterica serovar Bovismorbificans TaxID=58097 RepID=A0A655DL74_SALET|nr:Uncharacterised protein [Salmonella enterica subsp. enterica serovar Bovismorbificans]